MELVVTNTQKGKTKAAKPPTKGDTPRTKRLAKAKRVRRGGAREGAGRKSLHPGKDTSWHATAYLTPDGREKLKKVQDILLERCKRDDISIVTVSDAIEEAIHRLHRELTRRSS